MIYFFTRNIEPGIITFLDKEKILGKRNALPNVIQALVLNT